MERDALKAKIYARIDELPTLPAVVPRLLALMDDPKCTVGHITDAISHDAALTAKILKVANSAYYGFPQEISTLERAVALLGFNMVKSLAISVGVIKNMMSGKRDSRDFPWEGLWVHSLAVGTGMKMLAERGGNRDDAEYLFVVGLLHDMGKIVLDQFFQEDFARILAKARNTENGLLYRHEREIIGLDHGEVGGILLERWKFPERIRGPVTLHHQHNLSDKADASDTAILRISDALTQELALGNSGNRCPPPVDQADLDALAMDAVDLDGLRGQLEKAREGIDAFFHAIT
jgi:putative nucleotidyltransferase with HDIG domain